MTGQKTMTGNKAVPRGVFPPQFTAWGTPKVKQYGTVQEPWRGCSVKTTGHYTQVIWKDATHVGCATYKGLDVCQYGSTKGTAGNMGGRYKQNVKPLKKKSKKCKAAAAVAEPTSDGGLRFRWSNLAMHYFSVDFMDRMVGRLESEGRFHQAKKKVATKWGKADAVISAKEKQAEKNPKPEVNTRELVEVTKLATKLLRKDVDGKTWERMWLKCVQHATKARILLPAADAVGPERS